MKSKTLFFLVYAWLLFAFLVVPIRAEESSVQPEKNLLDNKNGFYAKAGIADWKSGAVDGYEKLQKTRMVSELVSKAMIFPKPLNVSEGEDFFQGKIYGFGYRIGSDSGRHRGNFFLGYMSGTKNGDAKFKYASEAISSNSVFSIRGESMEYSIAQNEKVIKPYFQYDHDIYFVPNASSRFLRGLGTKLGVFIQNDSYTSNYTPIGNSAFRGESSLSGININPLLSYTLPYDGKINYSNFSGYGIFGLCYRLAIFENQEIDLGYSFLIGRGQGKYQTTYYQVGAGFFGSFVALLAPGFPVKTTEKGTFNNDIYGNSFSLGYTIKIEEKGALRIGFETRILTYTMERVKSRSTAETFTIIRLPDLGPFEKFQDKYNSFTLEYQFRF